MGIISFVLNLVRRTRENLFYDRVPQADPVTLLEKEIVDALHKGKCRCGGQLLEGPSGGMCMNLNCDTCKGKLNVAFMPGCAATLVDILEIPAPFDYTKPNPYKVITAVDGPGTVGSLPNPESYLAQPPPSPLHNSPPPIPNTVTEGTAQEVPPPRVYPEPPRVRTH